MEIGQKKAITETDRRTVAARLHFTTCGAAASLFFGQGHKISAWRLQLPILRIQETIDGGRLILLSNSTLPSSLPFLLMSSGSGDLFEWF